MSSEESSLDEPPSEKPPVNLEYAPSPEQRGLRYWAVRFLSRLSRPMPLGMYYLIMLALGIIATILAIVITAIVHAFH
jgi:hypothetical protein